MKIILNNKSFEIEKGATLATLALKLQLPEQGVAIAMGYEVIARSDWDKTELEEGVELMLTQAVTGG